MEPVNEEARPPRMPQSHHHRKQGDPQKSVPISLFNYSTISPLNFPSNPVSATTASERNDNNSSTTATAARTTAVESSAFPTHDSDSNEAPQPWTFPSMSASRSTTTSSSKPCVTPPYWSHYRNISQASQTSLDAAPRRSLIRLEDHTEDPTNESSKGLWARSVTIDDYIVVKGGKSGIGAYVVWIWWPYGGSDEACNISAPIYSEFDDLRSKLATAFPHAKSALPQLPPKSAIFKFSPKFLEARRVGLAYFLNCVLLNPEFSGSPILKEVLFSHVG
ncbi:hypothetical protein AJ78_04222 [Emergomyces pasteurianus Ep9510]|uniref:Endosomal/vacuolar adapter protein YPT35 n=1 Tax=Emergomyces pasteurianus Ep9510 TaxID=1447872 RepID=A0A1J9PHP5_9EURO|nr:hypothetical protein AJ78_04222 [Emergomyces pasteurianus Ep9510]